MFAYQLAPRSLRPALRQFTMSRADMRRIAVRRLLE
jgi:hypothetical protein